MRLAWLVVAALVPSTPGLCQDAEKSQDPTKTEAKSPSADFEPLLYRAFWADRVERDVDRALKLYKAFLDAVPDHEHAPRAAAYAVALMRRNDQREAAVAFSTKHAALLEKVDTDVLREGRGGRFGPGRGGFGRGDGPGRGGFGRGRGGGEGRGRGPGAGPGRGAPTNPLAARMPKPLTEMTDAERKTFVERYGKIADEQVAQLEERGDDANADKLAKAIAAIRSLIDAGKHDEAQKAIEAMQESLSSARGRRRR